MNKQSLTSAMAAALLLGTSTQSAHCETEMTQQDFPHEIQFELGADGFFNGDNVTIESVRGDREHIEAGGGYWVEGAYTLTTAPSADLALFCTTHGLSGSTPVQTGERLRISKGSGKFHLYETNIPDGWLHVTLYAKNSHLHGGVYFGEKGKESTMMRNQSWYRDIIGHLPGEQSHVDEIEHSSKANQILVAYLGDPVPSPANMDARYSKEGLIGAIEVAAQNAKIKVKKVAIEDSEFPFLVGVVCTGSDVAKLKAQIKKLDGYEYGGSVGNDRNSDGSDTCNAMNIVPYRAYPKESGEQIQHRLMLRQQVFYSELTAQE